MEYEQYIKIPLSVLIDNNLKPISKVLFTLFIMLVQQDGYYFVENDFKYM